MQLRRGFLIVGALATCLALPGLTQAKDWMKQGEETVKLGGGVFFPSFDTSVRVNNTDLGAGAGADLEDDLGLKSNTSTFWGTAQWRIAPRHRLGLSYFQTKRDSSATANENIEIGDGQIIRAGATAFTEFKLSALPINYSYSFIKNDKHELAGSLGLHWYQIDFSVDATAWVEDIRGTESVSASADAPLPLIGLRYDYHISPKWSINALGEIFALDLSDETFAFSGSLYNVRLGGEYWAWNQFGIGAAVNLFGLDVDVDDSDWSGTLDYTYWGPQVYIMGRF